MSVASPVDHAHRSVRRAADSHWVDWGARLGLTARGVVYLLIGGYILANTAIGLATLTFAIALYLFIEAILVFGESYMLRHESGSGWLLFNGIVTLLLAFMIMGNFPGSKIWAVGTLVGVSMLFSGISRLMVSSAVRRIAA